mmetsp:Transcript_34851/g.81426  ORF Transcript_34851/g.81426 Transcript_34851/m.81426 type:complete len:408 (+) Transcript_34851:36-1259(+)
MEREQVCLLEAEEQRSALPAIERDPATARLKANDERRLTVLTADFNEHVSRIQDLKSQLEPHQDEVMGLLRLRDDVSEMQRSIAAVEVQLVKERVKAARAEAGNLEFKRRQVEYHKQVARLREAAQDVRLASRGGAAGSCEVSFLQRVAFTPDFSGAVVPDDSLRLREVSAALEAELEAYTSDLEDFDEKQNKLSAAWAAEEAKWVETLDSDLQALAQERERLAEVVLGYAKLRLKQVDMQRRHASEITSLTSNIEQLKSQIHGLDKQRAEAKHFREVAMTEAAGLWDHRAQLSAVLRQNTGALELQCQNAKADGDAVVLAMETEIGRLQGKCQAYRKQRKLALKGFEADLSLVAKKLDVLDGVAEQVRETLLEARSSATGRANGLTSPSRERMHRRQQSYALYASY